MRFGEYRMDCLLKDAVLTGARCALGCRKAGAVYPERLVKDRLPHIKRRIRTRRALPLLRRGKYAAPRLEPGRQ